MWIPGFKIVLLKSWLEIPRVEFLVLNLCLWIPRFCSRILVLEAWLWRAGFGILVEVSEQKIPGLVFFMLVDSWI